MGPASATFEVDRVGRDVCSCFLLSVFKGRNKPEGEGMSWENPVIAVGRHNFKFVIVTDDNQDML